MQNTPDALFRFALCWVLIAFAARVRSRCCAFECPTSASNISTDRPDIANSSLVVPLGSLQVENGVDSSIRSGAEALDVTNTRLRLGVAGCTELLIDIPSYFGSLNGTQRAGFSHMVASVKRQLPAPFGFELSTTAGLGFPGGTAEISGRGYQPYLQFPWFTASRLAVLDGGGAWRFAENQQIDFHIGFGLDRSSATRNGVPTDQFFGIGYSIRLDRLFGGTFGR